MGFPPSGIWPGIYDMLCSHLCVVNLLASYTTRFNKGGVDTLSERFTLDGVPGILERFSVELRVRSTNGVPTRQTRVHLVGG